MGIPKRSLGELETSERKDTMSEHDTEWTDLPVCPYCGEVEHDWWDGLPPKNDGDSWGADCGNCEGEYTTTMSVSTNFDTVKGHHERITG